MTVFEDDGDGAHVGTAIGLYILGRLDPTERGAIELHLRGCAACRTEYDELKGLTGYLDLLSQDDIADLERMTDVAASVAVTAQAGHATVQADLRGLQVGEAYRLVLQTRDGRSQVVADFVADTDALSVRAQVSVGADEMTSFAVTGTDDTVLVSVPVTTARGRSWTLG